MEPLRDLRLQGARGTDIHAGIEGGGSYDLSEQRKRFFALVPLAEPLRKVGWLCGLRLQDRKLKMNLRVVSDVGQLAIPVDGLTDAIRSIVRRQTIQGLLPRRSMCHGFLQIH